MAVLTASILITASVWATDERSLEACLNGEVSASGLYPTQAIEDQVLASRQSLDAGQNGEVSATGSYITQALEDRALQDALTTQVAAR
jgi:hypothetical protein